MPRKAIPVSIEQRIRTAAHNRCGYCLCPQDLLMARLQIEHIIPLAQGGTNNEANLWLACPICNGHKADKTQAADPQTGRLSPLFNPRTQRWADHFTWIDKGRIVMGLTPTGRATVRALHLDSDPEAIAVRIRWIQAGWHPPSDI